MGGADVKIRQGVDQQVDGVDEGTPHILQQHPVVAAHRQDGCLQEVLHAGLDVLQDENLGGRG